MKQIKKEKIFKRVYLKGGGYIKMDVEEDAAFRAEMIGVPESTPLMERDLLKERRRELKEEIKKQALKINKVEK